jgi:hypothetical protein
MAIGRFVGRLWYYFRVGYSTYLTFLLGVANTLVVVYYLLIQNVPSLQVVFPHFAVFVIISLVVGVPLSVGVGWLHLKQSPAYVSELDIGVEANPYYYKLAPGHQMEVFAPINLELLRQIRKIMKSQNLLSDEEQKRLAELEAKMETLLRGGYVGAPKRKLGF